MAMAITTTNSTSMTPNEHPKGIIKYFLLESTAKILVKRTYNTICMTDIALNYAWYVKWWPCILKISCFPKIANLEQELPLINSQCLSGSQTISSTSCCPFWHIWTILTLAPLCSAYVWFKIALRGKWRVTTVGCHIGHIFIIGKLIINQ